MSKSSNLISVVHMHMLIICVLDIAHIQHNIICLPGSCIPGAAMHSDCYLILFTSAAYFDVSAFAVIELLETMH